MKRTRRFNATRLNVDKIKEYAFRFSGRINLAQERTTRRGNSARARFCKNMRKPENYQPLKNIDERETMVNNFNKKDSKNEKL